MKGDVIRKWDVIFFEEELGHEILETSVLQQDVSIVGKVTESKQLQIIPKDISANKILLTPLPARQHVARLPEETQVQQNRQFIQWSPAELQ